MLMVNRELRLYFCVKVEMFGLIFPPYSNNAQQVREVLLADRLVCMTCCPTTSNLFRTATLDGRAESWLS